MFDLRSIVIGVILMLRKYTCINLTIYAETNNEDYQNGILALPLIGLAVGLISFFIVSLKVFYDEFFISVLVLAFYNIITKSVNLKDTYKTLNYYIKPQNQSEQLVGIIGITLINLMYFTLFRIVPSTALIVMPILGFSSLIIASSIINRNKDNTTIMKYCGKYHIIAAFGISFALTALLNYKLVISLSLTYMILFIVISILDEKVQNFPNSVEGTIIEITHILFLIITYLVKL